MYAFIPFAALSLAGYVISLIMMPMTMTARDDLREAGVCVQTVPSVIITTPTLDHNYNPYCKAGKLVLVVPKPRP
jgi:hypothetical protein